MLSAELKSQIQGAYTRFLEAKELKPRYGQRLMIAEVAKALGAIKEDEEGHREGEPAVVAVEAGTGTGKTVAYSLAAIACAKASGKRLVIATATVALQEQIVHKDLPDLLRNSGLAFSFALAKGRGRYLCLSKLDVLLQEGQAQSATAQLFADDGFNIDVDETSSKLFNQMIERLAGNRWDGDRDSWPEAIDDAHWAQLTTDHSQCTNRHCPNFQQCAFYKAREGMTKVDVIVTNHDLVLADLALGGGAILPDPRETLYVFDEGHHLPDKAIGHFAHFTRLRATADWLEQIAKNLTKLLAQHPLPGDLGRLIEQVPELAREIKTQQQFMFTACEEIGDFRAGEDMEGRERPRHRFVGGVVPEHIREMGIELKKGFSKLTDLFTRLTDILKEAMDGEGAGGIASHQAEEWYPLFGSLLARAQGNWELWTAFTCEDPQDSPPMARWLTLAESGSFYDIEANASPILAAETLRRNLWNVAYGVLVTSATLTALGTFDRYRMRAGLPRNAVTAVVPSPFHHAEAGVLRVPDLKADPRNAAEHTAAIIRELPELVKGARQPGAVLLAQADAGSLRRSRPRLAQAGVHPGQPVQAGNPEQAQVASRRRRGKRALRPRQLRRRRGPAGGLLRTRGDRQDSLRGTRRPGGGGAGRVDRGARRQSVHGDRRARRLAAVGPGLRAAAAHRAGPRHHHPAGSPRGHPALRQGYPQCIAAVPAGNRLTR